MTRHIVIGDIHGCFDEFQELLGCVAPTVDDQIIALGDIVDRGPDTEEVLEFFRDTPNAVSLMGNHERKHILSARGSVRPALSQKIVRAQLGDRYEVWLDFMETFPRHIELPEAILVHGMFEPSVPLEDQRDTVVIGTLTGEHYMEQRYAGPWYGYYVGPKPLIVGHHHYLRNGEPLIREGLLYAIDTGVAHGGRLTALILPGFELVSVPSREDYWSRVRREFAVMAGSARDDLDLDWETLAAFTESVGNEDLPGDQRDRAERCAVIAEECERLAVQVRDGVQELCRVILSELALADDWENLSPKKRVSRYAQRAQAHPLAQLLYPARQGCLDVREVYKRAKTPRVLVQMAQDVGICSSLSS